MDEARIEAGPFGPVVRPTDDRGTAVLYLHHGHDVAAGPEAAFGVAESLARMTGATVVCARYRPDLSGAIEDVHAAYRYCQGLGPVSVAGERLGAWLVASLLARLRDSGEEMPRCAVFVGALLDLTLDSRSLRLLDGADPAFDVHGLRQRVAGWAGAEQGNDSVPSPLHANLHGLPPVQLLVAGTDPLLDDSLAFASRAAHDRVPVELHVTSDRAALRDEVVPAAARFVCRWQSVPAPAWHDLLLG